MSPYNPGSTRRQTSKRFHSSLTSLGPTAGSLPPALSRNSPAASSPLCSGPCTAAPPSRLSALGVTGLDSCVIPLIFLQRPLILWEVFTPQDSHDTCSLPTSSDCSSRGLGKTPNTRTKIGKLFFDILPIKIIRARVKLGSELWC